MAIKKVIPNHIVESADTSIPVGKGTDLSKLNGNSFVGLVPYTELGTGGGGVVSSVNVDYVGATLTVTVDGVSDNTTIASGANLTYTASPSNGVVVSDSGTDATIPLVNGTNAGLATPSMFNNNHAAATVTDSPSIDFTLTGQNISAVISGINGATNGQFPAKGAGDTIVWTTVSGGTPANLALGTVTATTQPITNSNGTGVTLPAATTTTAGLIPSTDFQKITVQTLVGGGSITWDANAGNYAILGTSADGSLNAIGNSTSGELYVITINAIGASRTITFNTNYKNPSGVDFGAVTIPSGESRSYAFQKGTGSTFHQIGNVSGGSGFTAPYSAGNGAIVVASGLGVTFARTSLTEWAFTVPDGVELLSGLIYSTTAQNPGANVYIAFNNAGTRVYNNNTAGTDAKPPKIWGVNMFGNSDGTVAISRANPQAYAITTGATNLLPRLTSVGSGDVEVELQNFTTALGAQASLVFFHFN